MIGVALTVPAMFAARVAASGDAMALREFDAASGGFARAMSWREWRETSLDLAAALVEGGGARGSSCAILAANTVLWPLADVGALHAGMVTVGVYPSAAPAQLRAILLDADVAVAIVDSREQLDKLRSATAGWERPLLVIAELAATLDAGGTAAGEPRAGELQPNEPQPNEPGTDKPRAGEPPKGEPQAGKEIRVREVAWTDFLARGARARREDRAVQESLRQRLAVLVPDDIAMLIYTSGSTGVPKGARLSHRCVVESARSVRDTLGLVRDDSALSFLPFAHAGERLFGLYTRVACGMLATLVADPAHLWQASAAADPTLFGGMPRFFEKLHEALLAARAEVSPECAASWDDAVARGRERARLRQQGLPVPDALERAWRDGVTPIVAVLEGLLGKRLRLATSGGAALPVEVAEYMDACGLTVLGAYGQTEHLCVAFNRPGDYRHDAVGLAMPGTTFRIAADGEVQVARSALTFSGYHRRSDESRAAFTDDGAWLRTGDLGTLDAQGFLRITGRIKELIALSNGKKVAPLPLEARLCDGELVAHAVVCGEGRPYLVALFTMRWPAVVRWQRAQGIDGDAATLAAHPALRAELARVVARANAEVSRPEQIRKFTILPHELSVEAGEITPTHKVRRSVVTARYATELESLYLEET